MSCDEMKMRLADQWRGGAEARDPELELHLDSCVECAADARELGLLWSALGELPQPEPRARMSHNFYSRLRDLEHSERRRHAFTAWLRSPAVQAVAACLILTAGIAIGRYTAKSEDKISRLEDQISNMRQMVGISLLGQQSAAERLKGIDYMQSSGDTDNKVVQALLTAMNDDSDVDVRLGALDALRRFEDVALVRHNLVATLPRQDSPLMQIAVMDQLVQMRERSSAPAISSLLREKDLDPAVRHHADHALKELQEQ